jgi:hypothetical protein
LLASSYTWQYRWALKPTGEALATEGLANLKKIAAEL